VTDDELGPFRYWEYPEPHRVAELEARIPRTFTPASTDAEMLERVFERVALRVEQSVGAVRRERLRRFVKWDGGVVAVDVRGYFYGGEAGGPRFPDRGDPG
jgi:hypothetical protein